MPRKFKSKSKSPAPGYSTSASTHRVPLVSHDYRNNPVPYPALKTEQGVFTTPPYSATLKGLWRFKDEESARESAGRLWDRFERYRWVRGHSTSDRRIHLITLVVAAAAIRYADIYHHSDPKAISSGEH
jgi:hypothetical protein